MADNKLQYLTFMNEGDGGSFSASVQSPLPVDGDSVYQKDVANSLSDTTDWTDKDNSGNPIAYIPFNNLTARIENSTGDNPKTLEIRFNRSVIINVVGLGCTGGGDFSNVKIETIASGDVYTTVYDDSADNTKLTTATIQLPVTVGGNGIRLTFATADTVTLSNIFIPKTVSNVSRIQATKPDNTVTDINATAGGNLKISLEELESGISSNNKSQLNVTIFDEGGIPASVDDSTESLQIIDYEHHEIHSGSHFNYADYALLQAIDVEIEFVLTTPNTTKWPHFTFEVYASQGATIELYEGTSGVSGGTPITPRNNNRNSATASNVTIVKDPTSITSDGTRASGFLAGGNRTAGFDERDREFVLKQNESYLLRITSLANNNNISWDAEWYEHIDKN